jgi:hypothetical protein
MMQAVKVHSNLLGERALRRGTTVYPRSALVEKPGGVR